MAINGSPIPNGYDNTYDTAEVSRPDMDRRANWAEENPEAPQYIRNKEEGGGSGGGTEPLILEVVSTREATAEECTEGGTVDTFNHTWQEVKDAYDAGAPVYLQYIDSSTGSFTRKPLVELAQDPTTGVHFVVLGYDDTFVGASEANQPLERFNCGLSDDK